jgi:hypothetical protein
LAIHEQAINRDRVERLSRLQKLAETELAEVFRDAEPEEDTPLPPPPKLSHSSSASTSATGTASSGTVTPSTSMQAMEPDEVGIPSDALIFLNTKL